MYVLILSNMSTAQSCDVRATTVSQILRGNWASKNVQICYKKIFYTSVEYKNKCQAAEKSDSDKKWTIGFNTLRCSGTGHKYEYKFL